MIIDLFKKPQPERFCSFCKRKENEVNKLFTNGISGLGMRNICDACIFLAKKRMDKYDNEQKPT